MMLNAALAMSLLLAPGVEGTVRDEGGRPLAAEITVDGGRPVPTDARGAFAIEVPPGAHVVAVRAAGHAPASIAVTVGSAPLALDLVLPALPTLREDVVVSAIRAGARDPVTRAELSPADLEARDLGQEMPFLLAAATPSLTVYADSGVPAGYSYFTLRGIHQNRVNLTLNGVPLSDPEEMVLYFANFTDFTASLDSIQVQRGVGTSSVGAPTFGGSVNFASVTPRSDAAVRAEVGAGSFGTRRGSVALDSGTRGSGLAAYVRASWQETDGFKDHSSVRQRSAFLVATRIAPRAQWRLTAFSGRERSQMAFLATDATVLETDLRHNDLAPEERDRFGQDFAQLQLTRLLGDHSALGASIYYNGAQGWFRLFADAERTELDEYAIDGHFVGTLLTLSRKQGPLDLDLGLHANAFVRDHTLDVVGGARAYLNTGYKREENGFVKAGYTRGRARLYADAQVRHARFHYEGDVPQAAVGWTFFNPKVGLHVEASPRISAYVSVGRATREPARGDLFAGEDNPSVAYDTRAVRPEQVTDVEAGMDWRGEKAAVGITAFAMEFRHEIALTGELSDLGLFLRRNVDQSHRRGIELTWSLQPVSRLSLTGSATALRARIGEWTQFYDVYGADGSWTGSTPLLHRDVPPLLTPAFLFQQTVAWNGEPVRLALSARAASSSHLDNTGRGAFTSPSYLDVTARGSVSLARLLPGARPRLTVQVANLLDRRIFPSGYSYQYFVEDGEGGRGLDGSRYFYPLASRCVLANLEVEF